jgi:hypothetical protein
MDEVKKDGTGDVVNIVVMGGLILLSLPIVMPPLLLFGGLIAALMTGNKNFIRTTTRLTQTLCVVAALGFCGAFIFQFSESNYTDPYYQMTPYLFVGLAAIVAAILLKFRWADPLNRQFDKMYETVNRKKPKPNEDKSPPIIARDALTSYSVADELIKWKSLKEEGVIDETEFAKIRDKLMQKDS